jgi:hypothetical protein
MTTRERVDRPVRQPSKSTDMAEMGESNIDPPAFLIFLSKTFGKIAYRSIEARRIPSPAATASEPFASERVRGEVQHIMPCLT